MSNRNMIKFNSSFMYIWCVCTCMCMFISVWTGGGLGLMLEPSPVCSSVLTEAQLLTESGAH